MSRRYEYRSAQGLSTLLLLFLVLYVVGNAVSVWFTWDEIVLLQQIIDGVPPPKEELVANDERLFQLGIATLLEHVVTAIVFLSWAYRVHANAHALGAEGMQYTPGWAVGWYFVPIANLFRPFQVMRETFRASHPDYGPRNWRQAPVPSLVAFWWALWIVGNVAGQIVIRMSLGQKEPTPRQMQIADSLHILCDLLCVALGFVAIGMVATLQRWQEEKHQRQMEAEAEGGPVYAAELAEEGEGAAAGAELAAEEEGRTPDDPAMRWILPVGRSGWAIAAGYLGLFSLWILPGPLALWAGIMAVRDLRRHPEKRGMGRAIFGIIMGGLATLYLSVGIVVLVTDLIMKN
ncbi:DUF4328 domain-containing protein [Thermogemmata fonticola]|uniref:DUF4328 domain-containing protein n=1 Tax=Thermogemmata fonticola TaxID=2755323 RepID=A0A7V8VDH0_9BACT|nr:DUF4328 domain-containing protein [Thermogemmata fonticola]MBA2226039.1 DUF4328 domain-containing protein [Thermogemmata fonticola]